MPQALDLGDCCGRLRHTHLLDSDFPAIQTGTMLMWSTAFEQIGPFEEAYELANDADWIMRARDAGVQIVVLDDSLVRYRVHDHNESRRKEAIVKDLLQVFRAAVHRRCEGSSDA
jgi:GT2 family glycosyltransferase